MQNFQNDWEIEKWVVGKGNFTNFEFNMTSGSISCVETASREECDQIIYVTVLQKWCAERLVPLFDIYLSNAIGFQHLQTI